MKKLIFGSRFVKIEEATCSWCGEYKRCFRSVETFDHEVGIGRCVWALPEGKYPADYMEYSDPTFFKPSEEIYDGEKMNKDLGTVFITKDDISKIKLYMYICKNCAKQIAKEK